jgi:SAM-dependent methyltransferase
MDESAASTSEDLTNDPFWRFERDGWERAAEHYDRCVGALTRAFVEPLLTAADVAAGMRLLDVGCGPGYVTAAATDRGARAVGIDVAAAVVRRARAEHPQLDIRQSDAHELPFDDASFDRVVSNFGVLHLASPERFFAEARRVMKPGGRFGFTVWAQTDDSIFAIAARAIAAHGVAVPLPDGPPFFRFSDLAECVRTLQPLGFGAISSRTHTAAWDLPEPTALYDALHDGVVRAAATLRGQPPERQAAIRDAMADEVRARRHGSHYRLLTDAHIVVATGSS